MKTSIEETVAKMEILYNNIYILLSAFQTASNSSDTTSSISVVLTNTDGTTKTVTINSFQALQAEITRIDNNYTSLINADNLSYALASDGSISVQQKTSFMNAVYLENFKYDTEACSVDNTSIINDMVFPNVKLPITIETTLLTDIYCRTYEITSGWDALADYDNPTILELSYLKDKGTITYDIIERSLGITKEQVSYYGDFTIESINSATTNTFNITLDKVKYKGLNKIGTSIALKTGDILVSTTGASKYKITAIDTVTCIVDVTRIAGSETLSVGVKALAFNETLSTEGSCIVGVPIQPAQQLVIFLSTENNKAISYPSAGIKLDTSEYKVIYENTTYTLDDFFSEYVTNFGEYLESYMSETTIPASLGIVPDIPTILSDNIKVIQINKHVTSSATKTQITAYETQKTRIQNNINYKQSLITKVQNQLDTGKYTSTTDMEEKNAEITTYTNDITVLQQNLLLVTKQIDTAAIESGLKGFKPKYRAIAFWSIQDPIVSPKTTAQNIIKYDVQYRYLSADGDTTETTSYKMTDVDTEVTVAFSNWIDYASKTLGRTTDEEGNTDWDTTVVDSVEDTNINQFSIPITESESIEVRIRALTEAGYPLSPIKSEWSEITRIEFPSSLKSSSISATVATNSNDLLSAEFQNILINKGLISHIANTIKETEKTYLHQAADIASGQYSNEQKNISVDSMISKLLARIEALESSETATSVDISVIDFNDETYAISNNTTISLSAGNYTDDVNILDTNVYGSIIRKKGYIRIKNNNSTIVELKSLVPKNLITNNTDGLLNSVDTSKYYNVPVKTATGLTQNTKQVIYFRNLDLTDQQEDIFKLIKARSTKSKTYPAEVDINNNASSSEMNVVYLDADGVVKICSLNDTYNEDFVAFTTEHPTYNVDNKSLLSTEFERIKLYTADLKEDQYQCEIDADNENSEGSLVGLGFSDNDFYTVGKNTCGCFLYPIITNANTISVNGNSATATLSIAADSELLIPFMFEFRMMDRFGNINGEVGYDTTLGLKYNKKIGIDMLINNETFKFDIDVTSKLRSAVSSIDSLNTDSVVASFTSEDKSSVE